MLVPEKLGLENQALLTLRVAAARIRSAAIRLHAFHQT
jgi:hypothetical protein